MSYYLTYIFEVGRRVNICNFAAQIFYSFKSTKNFNSEKNYGNVRNGRLSTKLPFD